jgi:RsiW-degrading membrane proteinase PrsW (M82 family)
VSNAAPPRAQPAASLLSLPVIGGQPQLRGRGLQTGLFQYRQPAFWLFVIFVIFTALTVLTEQLTYLTIVPLGWLTSVVLLTVYVIPVALVIYYIDLFEPEPLSMLAAAFVWGGVVAIGFAGATNAALLQVLAKLGGAEVAQSWGAAIVGPPVEEVFKYLGIVVLFLIARREFDDLIDGFVYGALVGLGFAAVENIQYFLGAISAAADQTGPVVGLFVLRVLVLGAYMHVLWTGISGIGFAYLVTQHDQPRGKRLLWAAGLLALAVIAHGVWNSPLLGQLVAAGLSGQVAFGLIKGSAFFIFLAMVVWLAQRREYGWFATIITDDVGDDVITDEEVLELRSLLSRWRARRVMRKRKGAPGVRVYKRMQTEQLRLALMLSQHDDPAGPDMEVQRNVIRVLRAELHRLPDIAPATPETFSAALAAPVVAPSFVALSFMPGHLVPATGVTAWAEPDPATAPVARIEPSTRVQVVEQQGDWSKVMVPSGWTGWVDGRQLVSQQWRAPLTRRLR